MILARNSITLHHLRDITTVVWYYKLQASTASPPAKPTTETPSGWSTTEPSYTEGSTNSLYVVQKTTFSDGTFEYSDVSLSTSYEAAKAAYNKSVQALDAVTPIATKTYSGLIGSANDTANATFYFAKIHPTNYTVQWNVSLRFHVTAPESYAQDVTIRLGGYGSSFSSYNAYTVRTGSIGMYYVSLYRATSTGISTNHKGHALGFSLKNATNPTNSSYKRTITVELLETTNCTVDMLDTAVKYASIDGTGSTNYSGTAPTEMSVATAGQNATNNTNTSRTQFASAVKAGAFGCKRYTLLMKDTDDTWVSFVNQSNNTGTSKTVSAGGHILGKLIYLDAGSDYASGSNTGAVFDAREFDFRYSSNCGSTLVTHRPVYLVGTIHSDGLFYFDADTSKWYTQEVPTTEDGKTYIYVGMAYSTTSVWLSTENDAYQYYAGKFRTLREIEEMKAAKVADNYLSADNTGIMVADMTDGNTYTPSNVPSGTKNTFINEDSFQVRDGMDVLASFGETSQIGSDGGNHQIIDSTGLQGINEDGVTAFRIDMDGAVAETFISSGKRLAFLRNIAGGQSETVTASLDDFPMINKRVTLKVVTLFRTLADGIIAQYNDVLHFTYGTYAEDTKIHGDTRYTVTYSATDNTLTLSVHVGDAPASQYTYVELSLLSYYTSTPAPAFLFGNRWDSDNLGAFSGTIGEALSASTRDQFACGRYNYEDADYAFMVGNGDENGDSNAFAVTWDGDQLMGIDEEATTGTDAALYGALTGLGWDSVINDGMIGFKQLLTKIIKKLQFTPVLLDNAKYECTQTGTTYEYTSISGIDDYNIIAVNFVAYEAQQTVYFVRPLAGDTSLTDSPSIGRFRGTLRVDWENSAIGIRCISAGTSGTYYNTVYFKGVYGIA